MKLWIEIILEWLNCLDVLETRILDLKGLSDGKFYKKLIELFSWEGAKDILETEDIVVKFLQDEYPEYEFDHKSLEEMEHAYIASLLLLHVSQEPIFYQPMCVKLQHETQIKIKAFLEMIIPHGRHVNREMLREIIGGLENDMPRTPITPKTRTLKDFFNSPAARSAKSYKLLSDRCKELRTLKTELEIERFEKADLQEDIRIQQKKVENLQKKLQEKASEIKALREEKMKPNTPQSCKKRKDTREFERNYKKEIDRLEDQLMQKQCEIDKLEGDNDTLNKQLTCMGKQYIYFKEKLENCETTLEHVQMQGEKKDRELIHLRMSNDELCIHLNQLRKPEVEEQSFEIDGIAPLISPSTSFNQSEVLSSVIDIQLQEAKAESASLKVQLNASNQKLEDLDRQYESTKQLLMEKAQLLVDKETQLTETVNKLSDKIDVLEKENHSILDDNKNLEILCTSQKESLSHAEELRNDLSTKINTMEEEVLNLKESLQNENMKNIKLNDELADVKSQLHENVNHIEKVTEQNNSYKTSIDLYNENLKEIILHRPETNYSSNNNLGVETTIQLIEHVQTILCDLDKKYSLKEVELQTLEDAMEEAKLKEETFLSQISQLEERDENNITEISKLKEAIEQDTNKIKQCLDEISHLKQVELEKQTLERDLHLSREEVKTKESLLQASAICIQELKQNMETFVSDYYSVKKGILNQINEYQRYNNETDSNILNAHKILFANYAEEQCYKNKLENELADNKKKLTDIIDSNSALENDLIKNKKATNNLEAELRNTKEELAEYTQNLERLEETNETSKKQYQNLMLEKEKVLLGLNNANDELKDTRQEISNMSNELKLKDERIQNLNEEISSLKLEKEHMMHLKIAAESEMKNLAKELDTKLLEKQRLLDQVNIDVKLKQVTLELVQDKFEKLSKEKVVSELKLKEVIMNLQEVRSNQDAVLKAQEKALKEKCLQLEQLQKEFSESRATLYKKFEEENLLNQNLQGTNSELNIKLCKQTKTIEALQETLKVERNELDKNKEHCKTENTRKLEIVQICEKLELSINDLKSTIVENCPKCENFYADVIYDVPCTNDDDKIANIFNILRTSINEIHASRKLILHLSNANASLNETIENQKGIVDNYVAKSEEVSSLKIKIQELNNMQEKSVEHVNTIIKHKECLKSCLQNIIMSRENVDTSLHKLQNKWDRLLLKSHNIFMMDKSVCDELKDIQARKAHFENTLAKYHARHFQNIKPLQNILWTQFLWSDQVLKNTCSNSIKEEEILNASLDIFSAEKTVIELELNGNTGLQKDIIKLQNEIDNFSDLISSFEMNVESNKIQLQSEAEKKLELQIDELTERKNEIESKLICARIQNRKLEEDTGELKIEIQNMKAGSSKEAEDLRKELIQLKQENLKIQEERNELSKRPKKEDIDKQFKDIHDKYKEKLDGIKLNMKTAYNEQIAKLNKEQEQCIQERLESLQKKMELQCRKQADELSKYKAHVAGMSSQIWNVGEKLLSERQEKEKLQKELLELKARHQISDKNRISSIEHRSSKYETKDLLSENKEDVLHKIAVIQERTTYERRCSIRSIQTMGNAFNAEDEEGEVFDNIYLADMKEGTSTCSTETDRLSTLKKRNALCKPHLKSSYPAEMQFHPLPFTEEEIKTGSSTDDMFNDSLSQSLLPEQKAKKKDRTQTSYKKPGPPTPSKNGGRLSLQGGDIRSPNSRILKERNKDRTTTTPRTLKSLFISRRQDENTTVTPRGRRRSSIFRKHRGANDR